MQLPPRCAHGQDAMQACTQAAPPAISARRHTRRLPRSAPAPPQAARLGGTRSGRFPCRAQQQEPQGAEAEDEAVTFSPPKFLFDEDPPPPSRSDGAGPDLVGSNPAFAAAAKAACARQGSAAEQPLPAPPPPPPAPPSDEVANDVVGPGPPKFLFDDLPEPATSGAGGGPDLISANPAFAAVLKSSMARQRGDALGGEAPAQGDKAQPQPPAGARGEAAKPPAAAQPAAQAPPKPSAAPADLRRAALAPQEVTELQVSAAEDVLHAALRGSRRTLLTLQRMHEEMGEAIKREESQFDRLHFALQKAKSDSARMHALQRLLDARRAPPQ